MYRVATFYNFTPVADIPTIRAHIQQRAEAAKTCGTLLIAPEGVNATLAGPMDAPAFVELINWICDIFQIPSYNLKWSTASEKPFKRLKVRPKKEIITMNRGDLDVAHVTGVHVTPADWNALIARDDILLLDTRNTYETEFGIFNGAVDPKIEHFSDFADYVDTLDPATTPKVAMFCTGGIRCEKASSYMLSKGFQEVYQLQGGILKYLETVPEGESQWQGGCFVFDERVALGHGLEETGATRS